MSIIGNGWNRWRPSQCYREISRQGLTVPRKRESELGVREGRGGGGERSVLLPNVFSCVSISHIIFQPTEKKRKHIKEKDRTIKLCLCFSVDSLFIRFIYMWSLQVQIYFLLSHLTTQIFFNYKKTTTSKRVIFHVFINIFDCVCNIHCKPDMV